MKLYCLWIKQTTRVNLPFDYMQEIVRNKDHAILSTQRNFVNADTLQHATTVLHNFVIADTLQHYHSPTQICECWHIATRYHSPT